MRGEERGAREGGMFGYGGRHAFLLLGLVIGTNAWDMMPALDRHRSSIKQPVA